MVTEAKTTNYWISNSALYIQLNATGEPNRIQASVVSGASILCYMQGIDGLGYDAGHNYQRWTLAAYPSEFPSDERRYVYVAIPRKRTSGNDIATIVFPSQKIDIYGKAIVLKTDEDGKQEEVVGDQIGSEDYYYIYLQGIISEVYLNNANDRVRKWVQDVDFGSLSTDEALASGGVAQWWKYNSVSDTVTFLKTIFSATFDSLVAKTISVKELFFGKKKITGIASDQSQEDSEEEIVTPKYLKKYGGGKYLSKVKDDTAEGLINFAKGLIIKGIVDLETGAVSGYNAKITELGEAFLSAIKSLDYDNAAEQGFSVEKEENGKYHAFFTNLTIWGKAMFHELEVRKLSYSGGNIYLSGAGSKLIKVVPVKKSVSADGVTSWVEKTEEDTEYFGWKCYLLADDGTTATMNYWQEGDQARCQTMGEIVSGGTYQNASNKSYWRTIPNGGVSTQNEKIYGKKTETYLDEDGNEQTREVQVELYDGQAFAWIVISKHCGDIDGYDDEFSVGYNGSNPAPLETRDIPSAGDTIVLDGNRHRNKQGEYDKTDRQNVIILETTGEYAPRIACYANITEYKHTFTKRVNGSNKEVSLSVFETSPKGGTKINSSRFEWISDDGSTINIINYRGDWDGNNTYHKNDQVNHNNAVWVCVANSGVDVQQEPSDGATYWKKVLSGGKGEKGDNGENAIRLALTNENSSVSCDKNGNPLSAVQGTIAILYDGAAEANADRVTYSIVSYEGLSVIPEINAGGAIDNIEIQGGNTSLKASINIKAVYKNQDYYATYTITKVLAGSDGTPATIYWIEPSATAIKVDSDGNANPSTITCRQYKQVGAESPVDGDKKIYYRHNAIDSRLWNEYTEAIIPAVNVEAYEFVLADRTPSNSSAIIYDRESIPVVKDGQNGNDGLSGNGIVPAYVRSKDNPTPPTSTDKNNLDNGWSLVIPSVADVENVSYSDSSWTDYNDGSYTWKKSPTTADNATSWCLVTFTTTQANQTVMFVIKAFSEIKYDYVFLSEIDASNVPSKPGYAGASRAVSGNGVELSVTDIVATAGTHTVYVCYGKDSSNGSYGDYGLFRFEKMAGIPLWQSNGTEVFTRDDSGSIKSEIESWSEPFKVTGEDGADGEQGESALEIIVTPETLVFDTNDYGVVPSETSKQASISCYRNGVKVTNVSYSKSAEENCLASVSESNGSATVTISKITSQEVADDSGNSSTISNTNGYATIQVWDKDTNLYHRVQVKFMVNVAKFTGQMVNTNKQFSKTLTEVGNRVDDKVGSSELKQFKAEITQTAREISLSVSEKSIGRRNLLVGSAFLREDNNRVISNDARIEINSGYQGTNCIHVIDATEAGNPHYVGVYWDGSQGGKSIKIEKGKKYTISCYYKTNDSNAKFSIEAIYTNKETNAERLGRPKYLSPSNFNPKYNQWELFTTVIDTTDAESDYIAFNFWEYCNVNAGRINAYICRPMVEEGDTYYGWTLSDEDNDYVGANLIDNSRTFQVGGNILSVTGNKTLVGDVYELTASGSDYYNPLYRIKGDAFKLNTDYTLSFEVRGDAKYLQVNAFYPANNTKYTYYREQQNDLMYETAGDGTTVAYAILGEFEVLSKQQKVWVHFRFKDRLPEQIYFQFTKNSEQTGVTSWSVTITRPKIEVGAVVTEYTERKSDLIDKASLKAAGIEITSDMVELYGNQVKVSGAKGGTPVAMFENGMLNSNLINADKIMARQLDTTGSNGQRVSIEDGLMQIFGKNGACNIKFGVNDNGEAILSYYDKNGKWLYDLGPNKLDGSQITSSSVTVKEYVTATIKPGTNDFYDKVMYLGKEVKQVKSQYSQLLFGNNMFMNEDDEIKKNSSAHIGYQPFANVYNVTKLYLYSAPRMGNTIVKDDKYGLSTAELAKKADGKYFTSTVMASGGSLVNLAPVGVYFGRNEAVRSAPYPFASAGSTNDRFPAFTIGGLEISEAGVGSLIGAHNVFYSYLTRKVTNLNTGIIS